MSKFFALMITLYGLILLLSLAGISVQQESTLTYFSFIDDSHGFWGDIAGNAGILALCVGAGVAISFFTKTSPDLYIAGAFVGFGFISLGSCFVSIANYAQNLGVDWIYSLVLVIMSILGVTYLALGVDWVMNRGGN